MTIREFHYTIQDMLCENFYSPDMQIENIFGKGFAEVFESLEKYFYEEWVNDYWTSSDEFEKNENNKRPF